jgi:hypothetical protein
MQKPKPQEFKVRMSPELMAIIDRTRGQKSVNRQINDWLWAKAKAGDAERIASALRPVLAKLNETDRAAFVERVVSIVEILANGLDKKYRRRGR